MSQSPLPRSHYFIRCREQDEYEIPRLRSEWQKQSKVRGCLHGRGACCYIVWHAVSHAQKHEPDDQLGWLRIVDDFHRLVENPTGDS
jgi:hypothetical protein